MTRILIVLFLLLLRMGAISQVKFEFEQVSKLPATINSAFEETAPVYDPATGTLYFTRTIHPENTGGASAGQDIWLSTYGSSGWLAPNNALPTLNNFLNNSVIGVRTDGLELFLIGTYEKKVSLQQGYSHSIKSDEGWGSPSKIDIKGLNFKGDFYGGFNSAGNIIVLSMNSKESIGEEDLYVSFLVDGKWSKPIWMGDSINSTGYEISPYLFPDGKTLMFSSNGFGGLGDCDIFYAVRKDSSWTNWSRPINLGDPINSEGFDAFPYAVEEKFYFASNRGGGLSDLYSAKNEGYFIDAAPIRLVLQSITTRLSEYAIRVEERTTGETVGNYNTAGNEVLVIDGLKQHKNYNLIPINANVDLSMFVPIVLNEQGQPVEQLAVGEDGSYVLSPSSPAELASKTVMPEPTFVKGMSGVFELDRTPVRNVLLALVSEDGTPLQYSRTNDEGRFAFAQTEGDAKLNIKVLSELEYLKNNGLVYYTDEDGNKLFKAKSGVGGLFEYKRLETTELQQLKLFKELEDQKLTAAKGLFKYDNLPREGVRLVLVDENDNIIEEVITDANGEFEFKKLRSDQSFRIRAAESEDASMMSKGLVYFLDRNGREMDVFRLSEGAFQFTPLRAELMSGLTRMQEEDASAIGEKMVFSIGLFKYKNLPKQGVLLRLLDENDNIVETVTTDANGHFVFSMLKADKPYTVQVVGLDDNNLDESQMYFVSNDGRVITARLENQSKYKFTKLNPDYFFSIKQVNEGETQLKIVQSFKDVQGVFKYENLPRGGVKLYLLDENDKVIETVFTDENGNFIFSKLAKESNYFVRLAEEDASMLNSASFALMNEENQELESQGMSASGFSFKTLPRTGGSLASLNNEDNSNLKADQPVKTELTRSGIGEPTPDPESISRNDLKLSVIQFHFNSIRLSDRDRYHINREAVRKIARSGQPILIVGYSCDIGSESETAQVAQLRAEEVKKYLVSLGIPADRIETSTVPDSLDGIEKPTYEQRVEARRAEIYHLTP